jgi:hypothetical protein
MKFISTVFLTFALALGGLHLTSCENFTKADAAALGAQIARSSLAVAMQAAAGEKVDFKQEAALIGLQAASSAVATVTYNLAKSPTETPQSIVNDAHAAAQNAIAAAAVPDPQITAQASEIATQALAAAKDRLGADPAPSGK